VHPEALAAFAKVNSGGDMSGLDAGNHGFLYLVYRVTHDLGLHWSPRAWSTLGIVWTLLLLGTTATATFLADEASVVLRGALLLMAFVLSYLHVWEHHYSGMVLAGLVVVAELYRRDGGWSRRVRWAAAFLVLLAAPTPFALLDPHPDPAVWDPSTHWPAGTAYLLPLCKVLPLWGLYALGMSALLERLRVAQAFEALGLGPSKRVV
jgi:hypothetical protein